MSLREPVNYRRIALLARY